MTGSPLTSLGTEGWAVGATTSLGLLSGGANGRCCDVLAGWPSFQMQCISYDCVKYSILVSLEKGAHRPQYHFSRSIKT